MKQNINKYKLFQTGEETEMDVNMDTMNVIMTIIYMTGLFVCCTGAGISQFNIIYPTRYGKNHVELNGIMVGEQDMKVGRFRRIVQIPVIQFTWKGKTYEIADKTSYIHRNYWIGDEVIVCYNPTKNENVAIIKRGKFASETFWAWFFWFIMAISTYIVMILGILLLVI